MGKGSRGTRCVIVDAAQIHLTLDRPTRRWTINPGQDDGFPLEGQPGGPYCTVHGDDWGKCAALKDLPPLPPTLVELSELVVETLRQAGFHRVQAVIDGSRP